MVKASEDLDIVHRSQIDELESKLKDYQDSDISAKEIIDNQISGAIIDIGSGDVGPKHVIELESVDNSKSNSSDISQASEKANNF